MDIVQQLDGKMGRRRRLERKLQQNNMRDVWPWIKKIPGFKVKEDPGSSESCRHLPASASPLSFRQNSQHSEDPVL